MQEDFNKYAYSKEDNIFSQGYTHTDNKDQPSHCTENALNWL